MIRPQELRKAQPARRHGKQRVHWAEWFEACADQQIAQAVTQLAGQPPISSFDDARG